MARMARKEDRREIQKKGRQKDDDEARKKLISRIARKDGVKSKNSFISRWLEYRGRELSWRCQKLKTKKCPAVVYLDPADQYLTCGAAPNTHDLGNLLYKKTCRSVLDMRSSTLHPRPWQLIIQEKGQISSRNLYTSTSQPPRISLPNWVKLISCRVACQTPKVVRKSISLALFNKSR